MAKREIEISDELLEMIGPQYEPVKIDFANCGEPHWRNGCVRWWPCSDPTKQPYIILREVPLTGWDWVKSHVGKLCRHKPTGACFYVRHDINGMLAVCVDKNSRSHYGAGWANKPGPFDVTTLSDETVNVCPWPESEDGDE